MQHVPDSRRSTAWRGMNWIRRAKRYAIYHRDGDVCVYCLYSWVGMTRAKLRRARKRSLDHLTPVSQGGSNCEHNLVMACLSCNDARGDGRWDEMGEGGPVLVRRVIDRILRPLDMTEGRRRMAGA